MATKEIRCDWCKRKMIINVVGCSDLKFCSKNCAMSYAKEIDRVSDEALKIKEKEKMN